jgi:hypothetical protein
MEQKLKDLAIPPTGTSFELQQTVRPRRPSQGNIQQSRPPSLPPQPESASADAPPQMRRPANFKDFDASAVVPADTKAIAAEFAAQHRPELEFLNDIQGRIDKEEKRGENVDASGLAELHNELWNYTSGLPNNFKALRAKVTDRHFARFHTSLDMDQKISDMKWGTVRGGLVNGADSFINNVLLTYIVSAFAGAAAGEEAGSAMARNKVQFQKGLSEAEFDALYGTEERCQDAVFGWRWPAGFVCPACGGQGYSVIKTRMLYQCTACRRQTSLIAQDKPDEARPVAEEAIRLLERTGGLFLRICLELWALLGALEGRHPAAALLRGYVNACFAASGEVREPVDQEIADRLAGVLAAAMPADQIKASATEGAQWSEQQAVAFAIHHLVARDSSLSTLWRVPA